MKEPEVDDELDEHKGLKEKISAEERGKTIILIESIFLVKPDVGWSLIEDISLRDHTTRLFFD